MSEKLQEPDEFIFKIKYKINKRRLKIFFLLVVIIYFLLIIAELSQTGFTNIKSYIVEFIKGIIIFAIALIFLYFIKTKAIPHIQKTKKDISEGKNWYLNYFLNFEPYNFTHLWTIKILNLFYNIIMFLIAIFSALAFMLSSIFIVASIFNILNILFYKNNSSYFIDSLNYGIFFLGLTIIGFEIFYSSMINKKETYLFLYRTFHKINNVNDKRLFFNYTLLPFLKSYKLTNIPKNKSFFSGKIIKQIIAYYENMVLCIEKEEKVYKEFCKFHENIKKNNYEGLLTHINYLKKLSEKNKHYTTQIDIIKSHNNKIDSSNIIHFSEELTKIKTKEIYSKLITFIIHHKNGPKILGYIIIFIIVLFIILIIILTITGHIDTTYINLITKIFI